MPHTGSIAVSDLPLVRNGIFITGLLLFRDLDR